MFDITTQMPDLDQGQIKFLLDENTFSAKPGFDQAYQHIIVRSNSERGRLSRKLERM